MEIIGVLASTHLDRHRERIVPEALQSFVEIINGPSAVAFSLGHDPTLPPLGKVLRATLEPTEDGEYQVVGVTEIFEDPAPIRLWDGTVLLEAFSSTDRRPFTGTPKTQPERIEILYDRANFASKDELDKFLQSIQSDIVTPRRLVRKAWVPDPELVIRVGATVGSIAAGRIAYKIGDKIADKLGDRISEDFARLYDFVKLAVIQFVKYAVPRNRLITYMLVAPGEPVVELVVRTTNPDLIAETIRLEKLVRLFERADDLHKYLGARRVQFIADESGEFRLNYLLTKDGKVIGSHASFRNRVKYLELLRDGGLSMSGALGPESPPED
jgi:hypothetical protein